MTVAGGPPAPARPVTAVAPPDLAGVRLHLVAVPLRTPFRAAHGTEQVRRVVLVEAVGADGPAGWGECVALGARGYSDEWTDGAWEDLAGELVPAVLAGSEVDVGARPMAWTALEVALVDLALRRSGTSLAAHLGATATSVPATAVVGLGDVDEVVATAGARVAEGWRSLKLKVEPAGAVAVVEAVRRAHPEVALAADANGSFDPADAAHRAALDALDRCDLTYLEQPTAPGPPDALVALAGRLATPVAVDEAVGSPAALVALVDAGFTGARRGVVNLKPGRVGGLGATAAVLATAAEAGLDVFVGGMLETGVGRATALAVAALPACTLPTDLGPSRRYVLDDITEPLEEAGPGRMAVPRGPGLGVTPRPDRLAEVVERSRAWWR